MPLNVRVNISIDKKDSASHDVPFASQISLVLIAPTYGEMTMQSALIWVASYMYRDGLPPHFVYVAAVPGEI